MEKINYPLCCYCNGEIIVEGENVAYKDGEQYFVFVSSNQSFNEICSLICDELEVDSSEFVLKIKMKYPSAKGYKLLSLDNARGLRALWASVYHSNAASMDLYIEVTPIQPSNVDPNPSSLESNLTFSNLLNQVMRGEDPMFCVSLSANNVDQYQYDGNVDGDEFEENEDDMLVNEVDDDDGEDLVTPSAPSGEFTRLHAINEQFVNSWIDGVYVEFVNGGEFCVGQRFNSKLVLSQFVRQYHIERNQVFRTTESKSHTVTYKCSRKPNPCTWTLRASQKDVTKDAFTIVTYKGPHLPSCVVDAPPIDHPNLNKSFIAKHIRTLVEADWGAKISLLQASMTTQFNYTPSYMKMWHAKQRAMADLYGDWEKSYAYLPQYLRALQETNPGTVVQFGKKRTGIPNVEQFDRVFWAFGPSIRGFEHCRPLITIDGTHLYGKYRGVLLIAVGVDANDQIFPLAFAIVDCESIDTWGWFMSCLKRYVTKREGLCVISDRHVGILRAMNDVDGGWTEPHAFHRYCIRHHASNINTKFKSNELKLAFLSTASAKQLKRFDRGMTKIGEINPSAKALLESIPPSKWSLCHDGGHRYGIRTTNNSECFNGVLKRVRFLPITALVKATFFRLNSYFVERRGDANDRMSLGHNWSKKVQEKLQKNIDLAAHHKVTIFDHQTGLYEVVTGRGNRLTTDAQHSHTVLLSERTCTCNKWQIYHYPCSHVMAVCRSFGISSDQYVDPLYSCGELYGTYRTTFHPVPDEANWSPWDGPILVPNPTMKRGGGRPKSSRIHNEMDSRSTVTCSLCGVLGHNKRGCPSKASSSSASDLNFAPM